MTEGQIQKPLQELIDGGCDYIIAASYGYGPDVKAVAKKYPNLQEIMQMKSRFCQIIITVLEKYIRADMCVEK